MRISVLGEYNSKKQFVIRKYGVIGKTKIMMEFEYLEIPKQNVMN
ncbi:hypothetical protein RV10_GL004922 [Enterococcus pallens]|nr:hypothetical protein RV10_GL004922 [Enterococcus pallens]